MKPDIDIKLIINQLREKRQVFVSEADFQLELAWLIKTIYPEATVRLEYCPEFNPNIHIDILVIIDGMWIPIELKYKTKNCIKNINGETFRLKEQGARDIGCYLYLHDIERVEEIRDHVPNFATGYTIMLTNELNYSRPPRRANCIYTNFSLHEGEVKPANCVLDWNTDSNAGTKKRHPYPIKLQNSYPMHWETYSQIDDTNTGTFIYLINRIS